MKNPKNNKTKFITIISIAILLISTFLLMTNVPVQAQEEYENMQEGGGIPLPAGVTPDVRESTRAFLSFRPNPVGLGQTVLVNLWINPAVHVSRYHSDYKVTITDPEGNEEIRYMDSYRADTTAWFEFVVDDVGEWTLKFDFPGSYFPPGNYTVYTGGYEGARVETFTRSVYYEPSSTAEQPLTVQEEIVYSWPEAELPTDYWTRPISLEKREWWTIAGGYPGTGYYGGGSVWDELYPGTNPRWSTAYDFHPWVQGPNSAHILWKRLNDVAGLLGGYAYHYGTTSRSGNPSLVYAGRCYQTLTVPIDGVPTSCAVCYDLRTGEMYYTIPTSEGGVTPNIISYNAPGTGSVPGAEAQTTYSVELLSISGSNLNKVNPTTGTVSSYSIAPLSSTGSIYYTNQEVMRIQDLGAAAGAERYRLIKWTTAGSSNNIANRIISNTTYARSSLTMTQYDDDIPAGSYRFNTGFLADFNVGIGVTVGGMGYDVKPESATKVYEAMRIQAYNLATGVELWDKIVDEPLYSRSCYIADHGKIAVLTQNGYFYAFDLASGNLAWKSETMDYPWAEASFGAYALQSAYGMLFRQAYNGVYAFDWDDGSIVWHYEAPSLAVYESPYINAEGEGTYPFNAGATIADGKMYVYNTEHTASWPMTRGWALHCINITNGELVWKIGNPMSFGAIADGYLTAANSWDGYMYVFGKGKSETTVKAPLSNVAKGSPITITGTVLDLSPAQQGTPCVSKDSMALQMEYLHLQRPIGGIWNNETITGVPVKLTAMASDGSYIDLGTTVTSGYYGTFGLAWTPENEGTYEINASFEGDDSYGSSGASTFVTVGPAPAPSVPVEPEPSVEPLISTELAIVIAVIAAVAIGTVAFVLLRRRE